MIKINLYIKYLLSISLLLVISCDSYLEETDLPRLTPEYYSTQSGVDAAVTAVYSYLRWPASLEKYNSLTEYGTDLFTQGEDPGSWASAFNKYGSQLNSDASVLYGLWSNYYRAISASNMVIQRVDDSDQLNEEQKRIAVAEMSFLRAYCYFDLVRQFGRIPLVLDVSFEVKTDFKRSSVADIYNQIIIDLENAIQYLPEEPTIEGKATRYSALHLLASVYLTRGSAVTENRGQQPTDMDNALKYAKMVIESGKYDLVKNFSDLWDINNQGNEEVVFSVQFTTDPVFRGEGNTFHVLFASWYEDQPGMIRDLANGRPYRRHVQTQKVMTELFDRKNDSRFYKSFKWAYYANKETPELSIGDTAIYYSMNPEIDNHSYSYFEWNKEDLSQNTRYYPPLLKFFDPNRIASNDLEGGREWVRMRLGETYLIAAEAAGRKGDYGTAVAYINKIRNRAAWHEGENKMPQYWREEGGGIADKSDTYPEIEVKVVDLQDNFVDFILDERGRELLGEMCRWTDLVRCEKLEEYVKRWNPDADGIKSFHKLRPIPQRHIDRLKPQGELSEEQNKGYY